MMAKFNGKKGKHRNLAESVLNAYFNSAGIGTKGSKPVKKKVPKMHDGGGVPHAPTPGHEMFVGSTAYQADPLAQNSQVLPYQTQNQNLWNTNAVGTGTSPMGGFNTGIGGEAGLGMQGAGFNIDQYKMPVYNSPLNKTQEGLAPGQIAAAQAAHLKKEGLQALGANALGTAGTMIAQSDDTTDNVRPSSSGRDILGSAVSGAAGGMALGPWGALASAGISVVGELASSNKAAKQWDEDLADSNKRRIDQQGQNALEYSRQMSNLNSQGNLGLSGPYAKYGGAVADILKKYDTGGPTGMKKPEGMSEAEWANILRMQGITNITPPSVKQDKLSNMTELEMAVNEEVAKTNQGKVHASKVYGGIKDTAKDVGTTAYNNPLDSVQIGLGGLAIGAEGIPVAGTTASAVLDGVNAGVSGLRSGYYGWKGDAAKAALYGGFATTDALAATPLLGNSAGSINLARRLALLGKAEHVAAPIAKGITGYKAMTIGDEDLASRNYGGATSNTKYKKYREGGPLEMSPAFLGVEPEGTGSNVFDSPMTETEMMQARLEMAAAEQMNRFHNPNTGGTYKEWDPRVSGYIQDTLFPNVGFSKDNQVLQNAPPPGWKPGDLWNRGTPWSGATISPLAQVVDPNFKTSAAHSTYINAAFDDKHDWSANRTKRNTPYQAGDILFKGSADSSQPSYGEGYDWFKSQSKAGKGAGDSYRSHTDMIIGTGERKMTKPENWNDKKWKRYLKNNSGLEKYYTVQGGNVGNTLSTEDLTVKQINKKYPGYLNFNNSKAHGGPTGQADYETEGGEVMLASPGDAPVAVGNGNYKQVASNLYQAEGPAHERGGIATQGATEPFMDASGQSHDSPYVFSDSEDMTFDATDILKLIS